MDEVEHRRRRVRGAKGDGSRVDASPAGDSTVIPEADHADEAPIGAPAEADSPSAAPNRSGGSRRDGSNRGGAATGSGQQSRGQSTTGNGSHPAHEIHRAGHESHRPVSRGPHSSHDGGHDDRENERGLRGLVGGGSTQVSVRAAMRARDAARPSAADIAEAEAHLTIVHRGWTPREPA